MFKKLFLTGLLVVGMWTGSLFVVGPEKVFAMGDSAAYKASKKLTELTSTPVADNDFYILYDGSADKDVKVDSDRIMHIDPATNIITGDKVFSGEVEITGNTSIEGTLEIGTDTYGLSSANPGIGTVSLAEVATYIVTDATGAASDEVGIIDGTFIGQIKIILLAEDNETSGLFVIPQNAGIPGGTSVHFEDQYDNATFKWSNSVWVLIGNIGGTIQ